MSAVFDLADRLVDDLCELSPPLKTMLGIPGADGEWGNAFGYEGIEQRMELLRAYRPQVAEHIDADDPQDRLASGVIIKSIGESIESFEEGDHFLDLSHMASSFGILRSVFDVMKTETEDDWNSITSRLESIDRPLADYRALLQTGMGIGSVVAKRQVESVVSQARILAGPASPLEQLRTMAQKVGHFTERLANSLTHAGGAFGAFADWLEHHYMPKARDDDGVGRDRYERAADRLVGIAIDAEETYAWGWHEFGRLMAEMERIGDSILPGAGVLGVKGHLETAPDYLVEGTDALVAFVEARLEAAVEDLAGRHFDVPEEIRPITVQIAPPGGPLGVYYMRPSEDFSRPGGVWYSVGGQAVFPLYQHLSTAYHEGFPGHHLQLATAMYRRANISRYQRVLTWYPGFGEGWGMYSEVLMGELGYLEEPAYEFGMLAKQMYRAARVVVDIGLHLGLPIDEASPIDPGEPWTFERGCRFMEEYGFRTSDQARDEVLRYLGWPGQAIAYKVGEREILRLREEARQRQGDRFDLKTFHSTVIDNGTMRLDLLGEVLDERLP